MTEKQLEAAVSRHFQTDPAAVFDAILNTPTISPAQSKPGDVIEVIHLAGIPFRTGHQAAVRMNSGNIDLRYIDTLVHYDRPRQITTERLPEAAFPYDHSERLPMSVWNDFKADPDRVFQRLYGTDPQPQKYEFSVALDGGETLLTIRMALVAHRRMTGWGQRRMVKRMHADLAYACHQIGQRLQA